MATNRNAGRGDERLPPRRYTFKPAPFVPEPTLLPSSVDSKAALDWVEMRRAAGWPPLSDNQERK